MESTLTLMAWPFGWSDDLPAAGSSVRLPTSLLWRRGEGARCKSVEGIAQALGPGLSVEEVMTYALPAAATALICTWAPLHRKATP